MKTYPTSRSGFTLSELLIVIAIIAVLATMAWSVMRSAQEDARAAATVSRITAIESLMLQVMEDYEVRRLPLSNQELEAYVQINPISGVPVGVQTRNLKRRIIAEMIRAEVAGWAFNTATSEYEPNADLGLFPTRNLAALGTPYGAPFDLTFKAWLDNNSGGFGYPNTPTINGVGYPILSELLELRIPARVSYWQRFNGDLDFKEPGELLYRILEQLDFDGNSGVEALGPSAVGDPDADGHPDIVDAWGESMQLRILQIALDATNTDAARDLYADTPVVNWALEDATTSLPTGYEVINPIIPRPIQSFRIQVVSPTLDAITQ